jgi:hypothetical protein
MAAVNKHYYEGLVDRYKKEYSNKINSFIEFGANDPSPEYFTQIRDSNEKHQEVVREMERAISNGEANEPRDGTYIGSDLSA